MKNLLIIVFLLLSSNIIVAQNGKFVETNGVKIYYETYGEGKPLLLIHGFSLSHKAWESWVEDLSKHHLLIIPDLRGHGNSTNPSKIFTHKMAALDMYGLMDSLNIDKFDALGQSSGAMTLTHMATMDSTRIASLILVAATSFFPTQARAIIASKTYEQWKNHGEYYHPGGEKQIKMLVAQFNAFANSYDDMNFTSAYLSTIKCPTLIIHGDRDKYFPVNIPVTTYQSIPNSFLWIVPNGGHSPAGIYNRNSIWSDVLYKAIEEFFTGKWETK